jgi:hypothetical protein
MNLKIMDNGEILKDKYGKVIKRGDFLKVNPVDDDWLDFVVWHDNKLMFATEIDCEPHGNVPLREVLFGSKNPAIIVGNIHTNLIEFSEF